VSGVQRRGSTEEPMAPNAFVDEVLGALKSGGYRARAWRRFAAALWHRSAANVAARPDLGRELWLVALGGLVPAVLVGLAMSAEGVSLALALAVPVAAWLLLCGWVRVELGLVRHPITDSPSPAIGPANVMSLYRGWAAAPLVLLGLSLDHPTVLAIVLGVTAAATDLVDGAVAVRLGQESRLGRLLDPILDSFLFSAIAFALSRWGLLPWWVAVLVAVRYFAVVVGGLVLLLARGRSMSVQHTPWGQRSTASIALALALTMASRFVAIPALVLLAAYLLTVATTVLALVTIARRAPGPGGEAAA
jgi:phosphatidylglycerophosphate synthase